MHDIIQHSRSNLKHQLRHYTSIQCKVGKKSYKDKIQLKLHSTNQDFNFLKHIVSNKENVRNAIPFRSERQLVHLKIQVDV